jgi:hypothetical protein
MARPTAVSAPPRSFQWPVKSVALCGIVVPLLLAVVMLTWKLSSIVGIHRDEAAFGLYAETILNGARPLSGFFNEYTAPMHSYIIAASFALMGESTFSLRISGVLFNLISLVLYFDILRRLLPRASISALWLMATLPMFVIFARISGENYSMNPLFVCGGIWTFLLAQGGGGGWRSGVGWLFSGLLFSLACWNHIISAPTVASIGLVYVLFAQPGKDIIQRVAPWFFGGVLVAALPKFYHMIFAKAPLVPLNSAGFERMSLWDAFLNMVYTLGGDALYARATGQVAISMNWILPVAALLAAGTLPFQKFLPPKEARCAWALVACFVLSFIGSWIVTPLGLIGSRIWLLPLWFIPAIIAVGLSTWPTSARRVGLAFIVATNLFAIGYNYFYTFQRTGGMALTEVYVGGRTDNSVDFLDLLPLVAKLRTVPNQPTIFIQDFNEFRLWFLMPEARQRIHVIGPSQAMPPGSLLVLYRPTGLTNLKDGQEFMIGATKIIYRDQLSTRNQIVTTVE